jgi:hypothetical protein
MPKFLYWLGGVCFGGLVANLAWIAMATSEGWLK